MSDAKTQSRAERGHGKTPAHDPCAAEGKVKLGALAAALHAVRPTEKAAAPKDSEPRHYHD